MMTNKRILSRVLLLHLHTGDKRGNRKKESSTTIRTKRNYSYWPIHGADRHSIWFRDVLWNDCENVVYVCTDTAGRSAHKKQQRKWKQISKEKSINKIINVKQGMELHGIHSLLATSTFTFECASSLHPISVACMCARIYVLCFLGFAMMSKNGKICAKWKKKRNHMKGAVEKMKISPKKDAANARQRAWCFWYPEPSDISERGKWYEQWQRKRKKHTYTHQIQQQ